jgi:hypothetical protein
MPKSKNRKNHKQKVAARNQRLQHEAKVLQNNIENFSKHMAEALEKKKNGEDISETTADPTVVEASEVVEVETK